MKKFKKQASKILKIIRIFDKEGLISLTNLTMMLIMYKVAVTPVVSMTDITMLSVAVMGYQVKRVVSHQTK